MQSERNNKLPEPKMEEFNSLKVVAKFKYHHTIQVTSYVFQRIN